jgi:hypothetical protein
MPVDASVLDLRGALGQAVPKRGRALTGWLIVLGLVAMIGESALWWRLRR